MQKFQREWYGDQARVVRQFENGSVIDYGCPGKGIITSVSVFPGVQLSLQDMDTEAVFASHVFPDDVLSINYCLEGRQESEFKDHTVSYLPQHHLSVNGTTFLPVSFSFPLRKYQGISLVVEKKALDPFTKELLSTFGIDLFQMEERLNLKNKWFLARQSEEMDHFYGEILEIVSFQGEVRNPGRLRLKVLELLQGISMMDNASDDEHAYFTAEQIEKTKQIAADMVSDPESRKTLEERAREQGISPSAFHKVFLQIYDCTPHLYLKKYKMNLACIALGEGRKVSDVALELGYSNPSKFSKAFQSVYGVLPKAYQRQNRK